MNPKQEITLVVTNVSHHAPVTRVTTAETTPWDDKKEPFVINWM
tara:strand:- start:297 stop:428 length:132 start_codon:yes stop_codon:yes gene_type:complete